MRLVVKDSRQLVGNEAEHVEGQGRLDVWAFLRVLALEMRRFGEAQSSWLTAHHGSLVSWVGEGQGGLAAPALYKKRGIIIMTS